MNSDISDWVNWHKACDAMQTEMLKELRKHFKNKAVMTHQEIDAILCEVHHPKQPD